MICSGCLEYFSKDGVTDKHVECTSCGSKLHEVCSARCVKCGKVLCDSCAISNGFKCKECESVVKFEMEFISSTMFESFLKCPYLFKHEFILNTFSEEEKQNKYSVIGTLLHGLFDKYSLIRPLEEGHLVGMRCEFQDAMQKVNPSLFYSPEDFCAFEEIGLNTITNWYVEEQSRPVPLYTEKQHFLELHPELPKIRVTIDRINGNADNPSEWEVIDYKTGKVYAGDKLKSNMQFPIYAMAIKQLYGALPKKMTFYFPQHEDSRTFERVDEDTYICRTKRTQYELRLSEKLEQMVDIYKQIKRDNFQPNTKNSHFCNNFCTLGVNGSCDGLETKWGMTKQREY